jgi:hypothetical protein
VFAVGVYRQLRGAVGCGRHTAKRSDARIRPDQQSARPGNQDISREATRTDSESARRNQEGAGVSDIPGGAATTFGHERRARAGTFRGVAGTIECNRVHGEWDRIRENRQPGNTGTSSPHVSNDSTVMELALADKLQQLQEAKDNDLISATDYDAMRHD